VGSDEQPVDHKPGRHGPAHAHRRCGTACLGQGRSASPADRHAYGDSHSDAHADRYGDANGDTNGDIYPYRDTGAHKDVNADGNSDCYGERAASHRDAFANADPNPAAHLAAADTAVLVGRLA
jgi:hypothetical protein